MGSLRAAFFRKEVLKIKEVNLIVYGKAGVAGKKIKVEEFKEFKNTFLIDGEIFWKNKDRRAFVLAKTEVKNSKIYLVKSKYDFFMTKWKRKKQKKLTLLKEWIFISKQQESRF